MAFAAGWSPCIGPILAGILAIAADEHNTGAAALLLASYSLGLAIPFLVTAVAISAVLPVFNRIKRFLPIIEFTAGAFVVIVGFVLVNNAFSTSQDGFISLSRNRNSSLVQALTVAIVAIVTLWLDQYTKQLIVHNLSARRKPRLHPAAGKVDVRAQRARRVRLVRQQLGTVDRYGRSSCWCCFGTVFARARPSRSRYGSRLG